MNAAAVRAVVTALDSAADAAMHLVLVLLRLPLGVWGRSRHGKLAYKPWVCRKAALKAAVHVWN